MVVLCKFCRGVEKCFDSYLGATVIHLRPLIRYRMNRYFQASSLLLGSRNSETLAYLFLYKWNHVTGHHFWKSFFFAPISKVGISEVKRILLLMSMIISQLQCTCETNIWQKLSAKQCHISCLEGKGKILSHVFWRIFYLILAILILFMPLTLWLSLCRKES